MKQLLAASVLLVTCAAISYALVNISVNIGAPYYGYAPADVVYVERYVPDYYVPQVFYAARCARVSPAVIVGQYRGGWGFDRIYDYYGVAPYGGGYRNGYSGYRDYDRGYGGPPYGNAYGHYKQKKFKQRGRWRGDRY